jgi:hypothetical protein
MRGQVALNRAASMLLVPFFVRETNFSNEVLYRKVVRVCSLLLCNKMASSRTQAPVRWLSVVVRDLAA